MPWGDTVYISRSYLLYYGYFGNCSTFATGNTLLCGIVYQNACSTKETSLPDFIEILKYFATEFLENLGSDFSSVLHA